MSFKNVYFLFNASTTKHKYSCCENRTSPHSRLSAAEMRIPKANERNRHQCTCLTMPSFAQTASIQIATLDLFLESKFECCVLMISSNYEIKTIVLVQSSCGFKSVVFSRGNDINDQVNKFKVRII